MSAKESPWMTVKEVASWLKLNQYTVYRMANEKRIPHIKFGHTLRFNKQELEANWIQSMRVS